MTPGRVIKMMLAFMAMVPLAVLLALRTPVDILFPLAWLSCGLLVIFGITRTWVVKRDQASLMLGATIALAVRAPIAWVLFDRVARNPDARFYWEMGSRISHLWAADRLIPLDYIRTTGTHQVGYFVWVAGHMAVQRFEYLVVATNGLIGVATGLLAYALARLVCPEMKELPRRAAWMVWLSTAMLYSDVQNMRDSAAIFSVLVTVIGLQSIAGKWSWKGLGVYFVGLLLLIQIRSYIAFVFLPVAAVTLFLVRREHRILMFLGFTSLAVGAFMVIASADLFVLARSMSQGADLMDMLQFASVGLTGTMEGSSLVHGLRLAGWMDLFTLIPLGSVRSLFAPLPWKTESTMLFYAPDAVIRFCLMPFAAVGVVELLRRDWRRVVPILAATSALIVLYAVIEIGGNPRHNAQWYAMYYLLSLVGVQAYRRYEGIVWSGLAVVSLSVWVIGMTTATSKLFFPLCMFCIAAWWMYQVRPWRHLSGKLELE